MRAGGSSHPAVLLVAIAAGTLLGAVAPTVAAPFGWVGQALMRLFETAAIPLLIVSAAFGLRQVVALPSPGRRLTMMAVLCAAILVMAAGTGAAAGLMVRPGASVTDASRVELGRWVAGGAELVDMTLFARGDEPAPAAVAGPRLDNVFAMLAAGWMPGVLFGALFFGLAFAVQPRDRTVALASLLEGLAHACEWMIGMVARLLPLAAFTLATRFAAGLHPERLALVMPLLWAALIAVVPLATAAVVLLARQTGATPVQAMGALKEPLLVGAFTATPVAAIPSLIDALCDRLGLSRGIVGLIVPVGTVMLRAGVALHVALIAVFSAQLYGRTIAPADTLAIVAAAAAAALAAPGAGMLPIVAATSATLHALDLPPEAVVLIVMAVDEPFAVLRNLVAVLAVAALGALACGGLPSERAAAPALPTPVAPLRLALTRVTVALVASFVALACALSLLAGVGVGMRQAVARDLPSPPPPPSHDAAPPR